MGWDDDPLVRRYIGHQDHVATDLAGAPVVPTPAQVVDELFAAEVARELHGNPGFLKWWREDRSRLDTTRQRLDLSDTSWGTAVKEELQRLESEDPTR